MVKFLTMKEEYSIYHIKNDVFIKVLSFDNETNAVNVDIFYKVNNKYRPVSQYELPNDIINMIATKPSEEISEEELNHFKNFIKNQTIINKINSIKNKDLEDKVIFGKLLHNHYILSKSPVQDFYRVSMVIPNEFNVMINTTPVISSLVPYVFADIFEIGNKFKNNVFLIDNNLFVKTFELQNRNLGIIFQFENQDDLQAQIITVGIFGIEKDSKSNIKILTNQKDLNFIKDMKQIADEQTKLFIEQLKL